MCAQDRKRGDTIGVNHKKRNDSENALLLAAENGTLSVKLKKYLKACRPPADADTKKNLGRLPNLAGFCAALGCGTAAASELQIRYPQLHGYLCAVLEDEVLNFVHSPALLNSYLKERLEYGEKHENDAADTVLQPIFEHDIWEDGE